METYTNGGGGFLLFKIETLGESPRQENRAIVRDNNNKER